MQNPTINFRLSPYQIARGLWIVRKLEPAYQPTSISKLVKLLYLDYLAKMSYGRSDIVPAELVNEVREMLNKGKQRELELEDIIQKETDQVLYEKMVPPAKNEEPSTIKTVSDFSPPTDWLTDNEDEET